MIALAEQDHAAPAEPVGEVPAEEAARRRARIAPTRKAKGSSRFAPSSSTAQIAMKLHIVEPRPRRRARPEHRPQRTIEVAPQIRRTSRRSAPTGRTLDGPNHRDRRAEDAGARRRTVCFGSGPTPARPLGGLRDGARRRGGSARDGAPRAACSAGAQRRRHPAVPQPLEVAAQGGGHLVLVALLLHPSGRFPRRPISFLRSAGASARPPSSPSPRSSVGSMVKAR